MDPRKLMERLKGAAALTEQDVGEFSHFKGKMMKISVHSYAVEDWGSLSLLESRGMAGLMRRDMLVINSCVKDIPVLVIQYMGLFGRRMLHQERNRWLVLLFICCTVMVEMLKHGLALNRIFPKLRTKKESYSFVRTERIAGTGIVRSTRLSAMKLLSRRNW